MGGAFDENLEADKIDDFGLFSILRIPLLIIGGILGIDRSNSILDEPGPDTDTDAIISNSSLTAADRYAEDDRNHISNNDSDNDQQRHERWHQPKTPSIGPSCIKIRILNVHRSVERKRIQTTTTKQIIPNLIIIIIKTIIIIIPMINLILNAMHVVPWATTPPIKNAPYMGKR